MYEEPFRQVRLSFLMIATVLLVPTLRVGMLPRPFRGLPPDRAGEPTRSVEEGIPTLRAMHYPYLRGPDSHVIISIPSPGPPAASGRARSSSPRAPRPPCGPGSHRVGRSDAP